MVFFFWSPAFLLSEIRAGRPVEKYDQAASYFGLLVEHFRLKLLHLFRQEFLPGGSLAVSADCHPVFLARQELRWGQPAYLRAAPRGACITSG
jgi:hypothetical protein